MQLGMLQEKSDAGARNSCEMMDAGTESVLRLKQPITGSGMKTKVMSDASDDRKHSAKLTLQLQ